MIHYLCDGCGATLPRHQLRYTVKIDVHAAYDEMEVGLLDLVRSHRAEILDLIEQLRRQDAEEVESQIYKRIRLDLCPACQRRFIQDPLRFQADTPLPEKGNVDVDAFLRSLGFGKTTDKHEAQDDDSEGDRPQNRD